MTLSCSLSVEFIRRKTSKQLSYRARYKAMSSHDQVQARKLKKLISFFLALGIKDSTFNKISEMLIIKYLSLVYEHPDDNEPLERPLRWLVTVDGFCKEGPQVMSMIANEVRNVFGCHCCQFCLFRLPVGSFHLQVD